MSNEAAPDEDAGGAYLAPEIVDIEIASDQEFVVLPGGAGSNMVD